MGRRRWDNVTNSTGHCHWHCSCVWEAMTNMFLSFWAPNDEDNTEGLVATGVNINQMLLFPHRRVNSVLLKSDANEACVRICVTDDLSTQHSYDKCVFLLNSSSLVKHFNDWAPMQDFPVRSHAYVICILTTLGYVGPFLLCDRLKRIDITIIIDVSCSVYLQGQTRTH